MKHHWAIKDYLLDVYPEAHHWIWEMLDFAVFGVDSAMVFDTY